MVQDIRKSRFDDEDLKLLLFTPQLHHFMYHRIWRVWCVLKGNIRHASPINNLLVQLTQYCVSMPAVIPQVIRLECFSPVVSKLWRQFVSFRTVVVISVDLEVRFGCPQTSPQAVPRSRKGYGLSK